MNSLTKQVQCLQGIGRVARGRVLAGTRASDHDPSLQQRVRDSAFKIDLPGMDRVSTQTSSFHDSSK